MGLLLTVAEVARELNVTPRWVHGRIASGELRALKRIGRGFRVSRERLDAFIATREVHGAPATPGPVAARRRKGAPSKAVGQVFTSVREARAALLPDRGAS